MAKRKLTIQILPTAKADLKDIYQYIAKDSVKYARIEQQLIIQAIENLYNYPDLGTSFTYKYIEVKKLSFRNYLIIYRFKTEHLIEVLTIHHHSRSLPTT
ncbi:type II toxin-antitoxin system RelE/ParE family toxin [Mucilaginibacter sp.]|uniref:type II toxin-antitoxin system RelE/ParE family toxin n=1 Tax=Mucilaginibacter sp. TaxID=1882438 RepID=UPI003B0073E8